LSLSNFSARKVSVRQKKPVAGLLYFFVYSVKIFI